MFSTFQKAIKQRFDAMDHSALFVTDIDSYEIVYRYLASFDDSVVRQQHNCNRCKAFLRQYGGVVSIDKKGYMHTLWGGGAVPDEFLHTTDVLNEYVRSRPVKAPLLAWEQDCGTLWNFDAKRDVEWRHFYLKAPSVVLVDKFKIDAKRSNLISTHNVLKRGLETLKPEAFATVLDLIADNNLYRGQEHERALKTFQAAQQDWLRAESDAYSWRLLLTLPTAVARLRNTSIGTLLVDISEGVEIEDAVRKFEVLVAPANYKRPKSLITPKMIEDAKATLTELGLLHSIQRRHARLEDIPIEAFLFKNRSNSAFDTVFDEMSAVAQTVNAKKLGGIEEVDIKTFCAKHLPGSTRVELLLENRHASNFVTLVTAQHPGVPLLFKWHNPVSWAYSGDITDAIRARVKKAGGIVDAHLRVSLSWFNKDDLDLHVHQPDGQHIYFNNKRARGGGELDIDANASASGLMAEPVENIYWLTQQHALEGRYRVVVRNYNKRQDSDQGHSVQIECDGELYTLELLNNPAHTGYGQEIIFDYSDSQGVVFPDRQFSSRLNSTTMWGVKSNTFVPVTGVLPSPNHWHDEQIGHKHYFFLLKDCVSDEAVRGFFNEYLRGDLEPHRKVFEILGAKQRVAPDPEQVSGLGFSETQRQHVIVRLDQSRPLRVMF